MDRESMYSKYIHKTYIYIYHIVCKQYICKQIINFYVFIVYDEFCIYVYNYKKEMNISIEEADIAEDKSDRLKPSLANSLSPTSMTTSSLGKP